MACPEQPCGCVPCNPCTEQGCPMQLDFSCILYNKDNNQVTQLDGLSLPNGTTLKAVIEELDERIKQLKIDTLNLPFLRDSYTVNTIQQFVVAVDQALAALDGAAAAPPVSQVNGYLGELTSDPSALNGQYWFRTDSNVLKIKVNNTVKTITTT